MNDWCLDGKVQDDWCLEIPVAMSRMTIPKSDHRRFHVLSMGETLGNRLQAMEIRQLLQGWQWFLNEKLLGGWATPLKNM